MSENTKLFQNVVKNDMGYYELASSCRREMANFYRDKNVGHDGHIARIFVENMLFAESIEKTLELHQALANLGVGRNISVYHKRMV